MEKITIKNIVLAKQKEDCWWYCTMCAYSTGGDHAILEHVVDHIRFEQE